MNEVNAPTFTVCSGDYMAMPAKDSNAAMNRWCTSHCPPPNPVAAVQNAWDNCPSSKVIVAGNL